MHVFLPSHFFISPKKYDLDSKKVTPQNSSQTGFPCLILGRDRSRGKRRETWYVKNQTGKNALEYNYANNSSKRVIFDHVKKKIYTGRLGNLIGSQTAFERADLFPLF